MARTRQRAYSTLTADLQQFTDNAEAKMLAVVRDSIVDVVKNAQTPTAAGGRMRVDTGFLQKSGAGAIGSMPSGEAVRPKSARKGQYSWNGDNLDLTVSKMKLGDTFYWGWTANYAAVRELYDGFLEGALINWARIVAFHVADLKGKIK